MCGGGCAWRGEDGVWRHAFTTENALGTPADRELVEEYRPFVKNYYFAKAAGHYNLEVSDDGVSVAFYGGDATIPTRKFALRINGKA